MIFFTIKNSSISKIKYSFSRIISAKPLSEVVREPEPTTCLKTLILNIRITRDAAIPIVKSINIKTINIFRRAFHSRLMLISDKIILLNCGLVNSSSTLIRYTAIAYYETGRKDSTEKFLNILIARSEQSPVGSPSFFIAAIYSTMGKKDRAIQSRQKAYKDHKMEMYWLKVVPLFNSLHNDPRFKELLAKIGFKQIAYCVSS